MHKTKARLRNCVVVEKILILISFCLAMSLALPRAHAQGGAGSVEHGEASSHTVVNFADLAAHEKPTPPGEEKRVVPFMGIPPNSDGLGAPTGGGPPGLSPSTPAPSAPSPSATSSFAALGDNDTAIPPDTMGAVGPNHVMVALNTQVLIQNRSGGTVSGPVSLRSFWNGGNATGPIHPFDPHVVYDPYNNRWIIAASGNAESTSSSVLIGVSQTNDPTGTWNLFSVAVAQGADPNLITWADYPALGFNKNWVVVAENIFNFNQTASTNSFVQGNIYAFSKANLYAVSPTATFALSSDTNAFTNVPAVTYDNTIGTMYLLQNWNSSSGFLRLSTITGSVGSEVFYTFGSSCNSTGAVCVSSGSSWAGSAGSGDFAPQSGTSNKIQNGDSRIINAVYRNGSIWGAQNAFLPAVSPTRTAAQWWQIAPNGTVQQFGRVDDPSGNLCPGATQCFYAYPSIAVNARGDVLLGYSSFSSGQFAAADYSVRAATDAASTLRGDLVMKAGEASYYKIFTGSQNRWGDYSSTVVDPANDLDMWTIQEYASSPNFGNGDNRWGTWWGKVTPPRQVRGQTVSE